MVEGHHVRSVDERQPQVLGHEAGGEVLAAAHQLLGGVATGTGALGKGGKLFADGIGEPQLIGDIEIALPDVGEQVLTGHMVVHMRIDEIQQVGDLRVGLMTAAARTYHHEAARGIGVDDPLDLFEMLGVGDRGAAELSDLDHMEQMPFPWRTSRWAHGHVGSHFTMSKCPTAPPSGSFPRIATYVSNCETTCEAPLESDGAAVLYHGVATRSATMAERTTTSAARRPKHGDIPQHPFPRGAAHLKRSHPSGHRTRRRSICER
ncbi:Uncharacterised protein [Collinsella intestinalis]|nr:Uncharacterised protein [Collinsella intestinalis]